jgi:hypothetical protein
VISFGGPDEAIRIFRQMSDRFFHEHMDAFVQEFLTNAGVERCGRRDADCFDLPE